MDCFYINLDSASQRKSQFENNFDAIKNQNWTLSRFSAIDTEYVKKQNIMGDTSAAEKACFLSHKTLIGSNLNHERPIFVLEDDAAFGIRTCSLIDAILQQNKNPDWDILFTDVGIPHLVNMVELLTRRRELAAKKIATEFLKLSKINFVGSTAYIVNSKSKQKMYDLLNAATEFSIPYDLYLRSLIHMSALKGFSLFPFVTSLSEFSEISQIKISGAKRADATWNMFRKMIWTERNLENCKSSLEAIKNTLCDKDMNAFRSLLSASDKELNAFGILFSLMASTPA